MADGVGLPDRESGSGPSFSNSKMLETQGPFESKGIESPSLYNYVKEVSKWPQAFSYSVQGFLEEFELSVDEGGLRI